MNAVITQDEIFMLQVLTSNVQDLTNTLQRAMQARQSGIKLLESKYQAKLDEKTGQFIEIEEPKAANPEV